MSLEIWLVRHGESAWNVEHRLTGWTDVALTDRGREQAAAVRDILQGRRFDRVWSSDLSRAADTARLAYGEPTVDRRLREMDFGALEGRSWYDVPKPAMDGLLNFDRDYRIDGGESLAELQARAVDFVCGLASGRHILFSHGGTIRALMEVHGRTSMIQNCGVVGLDWTTGQLLFEHPERNTE